MQEHNLDPQCRQGRKSMLGLHNLISTPPIGLVFTYIGLTNIIIRAEHQHNQTAILIITNATTLASYIRVIGYCLPN